MSYHSLGLLWSKEKGFEETTAGTWALKTYPGAECYGGKGVSKNAAKECGAKMGKDGGRAGCAEAGVTDPVLLDYCGEAGAAIGTAGASLAYDAAAWVVDSLFGGEEYHESVFADYPSPSPEEQAIMNHRLAIDTNQRYVVTYRKLQKLQNDGVDKLREQQGIVLKKWSAQDAQRALDENGALHWLGEVGGFRGGAASTGELRRGYPLATIEYSKGAKDLEGRKIDWYTTIMPTHAWFTGTKWWEPGADHGILNPLAFGSGPVEGDTLQWLDDIATAFGKAEKKLRGQLAAAAAKAAAAKAAAAKAAAAKAAAAKAAAAKAAAAQDALARERATAEAEKTASIYVWTGLASVAVLGGLAAIWLVKRKR